MKNVWIEFFLHRNALCSYNNQLEKTKRNAQPYVEKMKSIYVTVILLIIRILKFEDLKTANADNEANTAERFKLFFFLLVLLCFLNHSSQFD